MAGINPATGKFDPYYYGTAAPSSGNQYTTTQSKNGTFKNTLTFYNITNPGGSWNESPATPSAPSGNGGGGGGASATGATRTRRQTGGWVIEEQQMSDGSWVETGRYQDFGAREAALAMFRQAGLDDNFINGLMSAIDGVYQQNVMPTDAQILSAIYTSDAYKKRFAANETIRQRMAAGQGRPGDRLLSPKEYMDLENSYKTVMQDAGMPTGFYDQQEDFTGMIANGVSVAELKSRVDTAYQALNVADENVKSALRDYYGLTTGEMVAYLLDPTRATPLLMGKQGLNEFGLNDRTALQKAYTAADLGGAQRRLGQDGGRDLNEEIANLGLEDNAMQAMGGAASNAADVSRLGNLYGDGSLGFGSLMRESLGLSGAGDAQRKRKKFASKERAAFSAQGGLDRTSLSSSSDV